MLSCIHTTIWMHHTSVNKTYSEKTRREIHKNATRCLEQILEVIPHKTAAVRSLTSHLTNQSSKINKTCGCSWRSKDELVSDGLLRTPTHAHGHASVGRPTFSHQLPITFTFGQIPLGKV